MSLTIYAPCDGRIVDLKDVPDPVFANMIVGPGVAIDPPRGSQMTVKAPVAGTVAKVHPHAFVIVTEGGVGVLVHIGLDTVSLSGEGFTVHASENQTVTVGDPMVSWNPQEIEGKGINPVIPVIVMEANADNLTITTENSINDGDVLLEMR